MAAAILATAPLYAVMAQVLTTDMLLSALTTIAIFALFLHFKEGGIWCWIAYLAMALATLTKGPVGIALPALTMLVFLWWERALKGSIRRFHAIAGASAGARDRRAMVHRDQHSRAGLPRFLFHRRAHPQDLRFIVLVTASRLTSIIPVVIAGLLAMVVAGAVSDLAQDAAQSGAPLLRDRRAGDHRRLLRLERQADSIHHSGVSSARSLARRWNRCVRVGRSESRPLRSPDSRILMESGPLLGLLGAGVIIAAIEGRIVSHALSDIVAARAVCDRRDPRVRRRDDDHRVFRAAQRRRAVVDRHHTGGGAMRLNLGAPRRRAAAIVREPQPSGRGARAQRENHLLPSLCARIAVLYAAARDPGRTADAN